MYKKILVTFSMVMIFLLTACETESVVEEYSIENTLSKTTPLSTYLERVAMQNTALDNEIDNSSCFMIQFPYNVTVNSIQINIQSENDYVLVHNAIIAYSYDNDMVFIQFPVTLIHPDYSQEKIVNQSEFNNHLISCQSKTTAFGKIDCLNIQYPVLVKVYNSNSQMASTTSITSNESLFAFFNTLQNYQLVSFQYPIQTKNSLGVTTVITSNNELENAIKVALDSCTQNSNSSLDFVSLLTSNSWKLSYCFYEGYNITSNYDGFTFQFNINNTIIATKGGVRYYGEWYTKMNNGTRELKIKFDEDSLEKMNEEWKLLEFNELQIRFRHSGSSNTTDYLYLEKK